MWAVEARARRLPQAALEQACTLPAGHFSRRGGWMRWIGSAALCAALLTAIARAGTSADCDAPAAMSDGWEVATPAQQGLDPKLICAIGPSFVELKGADPHGVVVARR